MLTVATSPTVSPANADPIVSAFGETLIPIAGAWVTVKLAEIVTDGAVTEAAVIVTAPEGGVDGAVYSVEEPAALPSVPHAPAPVAAQETVQLAPASAGSLATRTLNVALWDVSRDVTGAEVNEMEMEGRLMETVALLVAEGSLVIAAVMVTVSPIGTLEGAE